MNMWDTIQQNTFTEVRNQILPFSFKTQSSILCHSLSTKADVDFTFRSNGSTRGFLCMNTPSLTLTRPSEETF